MEKFKYYENGADISEEHEATLIEMPNGDIVEEKGPKKLLLTPNDSKTMMELAAQQISIITENQPEEIIEPKKDLNAIVQERVNEKLSLSENQPVKEETPIDIQNEVPSKPIYSFEQLTENVPSITEKKENTIMTDSQWHEELDVKRNSNYSYARTAALNYLEKLDGYIKRYNDPTVGEYEKEALENSIPKVQLDLENLNKSETNKLEKDAELETAKLNVVEAVEEVKKQNFTITDSITKADKNIEEAKKVDIYAAQCKQAAIEEAKAEEIRKQKQLEEESRRNDQLAAKVENFQKNLFIGAEKQILSVQKSNSIEEKEEPITENSTIAELKEFKDNLQHLNIDEKPAVEEEKAHASDVDSYLSFDFDDYLKKSGISKAA